MVELKAAPGSHSEGARCPFTSLFLILIPKVETPAAAKSRIAEKHLKQEVLFSSSSDGIKRVTSSEPRPV